MLKMLDCVQLIIICGIQFKKVLIILLESSFDWFVNGVVEEGHLE